MPVWSTYSERVNYAARCFLTGSGLHSRTFDSCFEMWDGDAVVTALVRRSEKNPRLLAAICRDFRSNAPNLPRSWLEAAQKYAEVPTRKLGDVSAALVEAAKQKQNDWYIATATGVEP